MFYKAKISILIIAVFFLFNCSAQENTDKPPVNSLPHYFLDIELTQEFTLIIKQKIESYNTSAEPWEEIILSCPPAFYTEYFALQQCALRYENKTHTIQPRVDKSMIFCKLPHTIEPQQEFTVLIDFIITLPEIDPGGLPPIGNFGRGSKVIQAGDFYATLTPYIEEQGFMQWEYVTVGDPVVYTPADYEVIIKAPEDMVIAAAGYTDAENGVWNFSLKGIRSFAFLASKEYKTCEDEILGIPIRSYYLKGFERAGKDACTVAKKALVLYSKIYGPYHYDELVIAQNAYLGAMEYSALCTESNVAYEYYKGESRSFFVYVIAHEIAHQWWYGAVGNDQVHSPWLDEAMAIYSEYLYYQEYHPADLDWWWDVKVIKRNPDPEGHLDADIYTYPTTKLYIKNVYGLAGKFIRKLHTLVGDESFKAFLLDYQKEFKDKFTTKKDFFGTLKKHTEVDLTPLKDYFKEPF
jgi:signal peptidase I